MTREERNTYLKQQHDTLTYHDWVKDGTTLQYLRFQKEHSVVNEEKGYLFLAREPGFETIETLDYTITLTDLDEVPVIICRSHVNVHTCTYYLTVVDRNEFYLHDSMGFLLSYMPLNVPEKLNFENFFKR